MISEKKLLFRSVFLPLLTALVWGFSFVAQHYNTIGIFTFTASRSVFAVLFLFIVCLIREKGNIKKVFIEDTKAKTKSLWIHGAIVGAVLCPAQILQQAGQTLGTDAGKVGFITAFYVVFVPILGIFIKKKIKPVLWISVAAALVGLYLISIKDDFTLQSSDFLVFLCSICYSVQIILASKFGETNDVIKLSFLQFLFLTIYSGILALCFDHNTIAEIQEIIFPILYLGIFSSGIGFTLQILAEKGTNPTIVSLGFSMEAVFGLMFSSMFLKQALTLREYIGCGIMFFAIVLSSIVSSKETQKKEVTKEGD